MKHLLLIYSCLMILSLPAFSAIETHQFKSPEQERIYIELVDELRCLVCQNQNLAASNSALAMDLRRQALQMIEAGQTKKQITQYMTDRYGDFVLYEPPFKKTTLILWVGPFIILIIAALILFNSLKQSQKLLKRQQHIETSSQPKKEG